jgi:hypothetical protein
MDKRIKNKLNSGVSKLDINTNSYVKVELGGELNVLPPGEINYVLDVNEQFDKERRESQIYRFTFTISPLFSNVLHNVRGNNNLGTFGNSIIPKFGNGLTTLNDLLFREDPYDNDFTGQLELTYEEAINRNLKEVNGWFGFYDPDLTRGSLCKFYDLEPTRERFDLNSSINKNWGMTITYPYASDDTHIIVNGGLNIIEAESVLVGNVPMVALGVSTKHGLNNGDTVRLLNMPNSNYEGDFRVRRLGLDNGDNKDNYFVVSIDPTTVPIGGNFSNGRMRRVVNGEPSTYYVRKFKKIMLNEDNFEIYPLAYSKTIFNDSIFQMIVNEDIDISELTDNLGRPLSELYLTFVKTNSQGTFGPVKSGFDLEFLPGNLIENLSNVRRIHDGASNDPFTSQLSLEFQLSMDSYDEFYGDIVEYNKFELKETVLSDVLHRFNTVNREQIYSGVADGPRREGYLYKPHHKIQIKQFSLYIEQGDSSTLDIPDYAEDLGDGRFLWRDLLDIGISNGENDVLDYPFTNGTHYIYKQLCLNTIRQDPFGVYDLFYGGINTETDFSPADPIGDAITDKFTIKNSGDAC